MSPTAAYSPAEKPLPPSEAVIFGQPVDEWARYGNDDTRVVINTTNHTINLEIGKATGAGQGHGAALKFTTPVALDSGTLSFTAQLNGSWGESLASTYYGYVYGFSETGAATVLGTWEQDNPRDAWADTTTQNITVQLSLNAKSNFTTYGLLLYNLITPDTALNDLPASGYQVMFSNLQLTATSNVVYQASAHTEPVTDPGVFRYYAGVNVDSDLTLEFNAGADTNQTLLRNLSSSAGQAGTLEVYVTADAANTAFTVELDNADKSSTFYGNINVNKNTAAGATLATVNLLKTGANTLTLAGNIDTADTVTVQDGTLTLNGTNNIGTLKLNAQAATGDTPATTARVIIGGNSSVNTIQNGDQAGTLQITGAGTLETKGSSTLTNTAINLAGTLQVAENGALTLDTGSTLSGTGTLQVQNDGSVTVNTGAQLNSIALNLEGTLTLPTGRTNTYTLQSLNGTGTLTLNNNTVTLGTGRTATSTFDGMLSGTGTLNLAANTTLNMTGNGNDTTLNVLQNANAVFNDSAPTAFKGITVNSGGALVLAGSSTGNAQVTLAGTLTLQVESRIELNYHMPAAAAPGGQALITADTINIDPNTEVVFNPSDFDMNNTDLSDGITLMSGTNTGNPITGLENDQEHSVTTPGLMAVYYQDTVLKRQDSDIILTAQPRTESLFDQAATTPTAQAGADLLNAAKDSLPDASGTTATTLGQAMGGIATLVNTDPTAAGNAMAAVAGSTIPAVAAAQNMALRDQLDWVRDRMTWMGARVDRLNTELPELHWWVQATGSFDKLEQKDSLAGYKLSTWGGTLGLDSDLTDNLSLGAALSARYGDLTATAAESADGHLNGYYLSLFAKYHTIHWNHSLILTGGLNDAELDRTVQYGTGGYTAKGSTNGYGFGAMYELSYNVILDEERQNILQPLLNLSLATTSLDAYTETGADNAGLTVGKQDRTTGTIAAGLRWVGVVGSNLFGREITATARVNLAQDVGDDCGSAQVGLLENPAFVRTVTGAKIGKTGVQFGIGLYAPVSVRSAIFVHGDADVRSGRHAFAATLGYQYTF